jgi:transcriptional regulator with XRE-family HTH domain
LRKLRLAAGRTTEQAAALIGTERTKVANIETGTRVISCEQVRLLAHHYGVEDEEYVEGLCSMAVANGNLGGWWKIDRGILPDGLVDITETEGFARRVRATSCLHIPDFLQTWDYAHEVFASALPPLGIRMAHLCGLHRYRGLYALERESFEYVGYVHEAALRVELGGAKVMREQLIHLGRLATHDRVRVRVVPFTAGPLPGLGRTIMYAEHISPRLDTVVVGSPADPVFLHEEGQLACYQACFEAWDRASLSETESADIIRTHADRFQERADLPAP